MVCGGRVLAGVGYEFSALLMCDTEQTGYQGTEIIASNNEVCLHKLPNLSTLSMIWRLIKHNHQLKRSLTKQRATTMLNDAKTLVGFGLNSLNGEIGKVEEFYFDDQYWVIRYLVADTGNWLTGRQVLISPYALVGVNNEEQNITIELTKKQIEESPSLDSDRPVSRQFEEAYYEHYEWPIYWGGPDVGGSYPYIVSNPEEWRKPTRGEKSWNPHLNSTYEVTGYHIQSEDGEIGHVEDFIIDDQTWAIRYLVIDTRNWWPGKMILVSTQWIDHVSWSNSKVFVNLTREAIRQSPEYTKGSLLARDYETALHRHYGRQGYWVDEADAKQQYCR